MSNSKRAKLWLAVCIITVISGALGLVGTVLLSLKAMYFPMGVCIALVAHGSFAISFYIGAYKDACLADRMLTAVKSGVTSIAGVAEELGVSECAVAELAMRESARGRLCGYTVSEGEFCPAVKTDS